MKPNRLQLCIAVLALSAIPVLGIQITSGQFSASDPVVTFETGSTALPGVPGLSFAGGDATFSSYGFGSQIFGNLNGSTYLDIYFSTNQQAVGAYIINDEPGGGVTGVIEVVYDRSNNILESVSTNFPPIGYPPRFLGVGEPTAQIARVEWQYIGGGYFGVDNVIYGSAVGLSQMPNIPNDLTAAGQGTQAFLNWFAADRAASYNVKRANAASGPFAAVATGVASTSFTDATVTNGGVYFSVVTAVNSYGESAASHQAIAYIVDHFAFATVSSPQTSSVPFNVTISACDTGGNVLTNFTGAAMLQASGDHGSEILTPRNTTAFVNGLWTGTLTLDSSCPDSNIRLTASSNSVSGSSNPFNAVAPAIQEFNLTMADLVYNPLNQMLYATIPASAATYSNCLVTIDPALGRVVKTFYLGNDPNRLSVSADGQYVYVTFNAANVFRRFNLASNTVDLQVPLPGTADIAALPGLPHSVAVCSGGVSIFDDAVQRSNTYSLGGVVVAGSANKLFAMGGGYPSAPFASLDVDASGITNYTYEDGIVGVNETFKSQGGLIFTSGGTVFNPATATVLGHLTNCSIVEPDLPAGLIFSMGSHPVFAAPAAWTLYAWNATNLEVMNSLPIPGVNDGGPTTLVRWGTNGMAFSISSWYISQFYLVRNAMIPSVTPQLSGGKWQPGGPFQLVLQGDQGVPYSVSASTNLANWAPIGIPNLVSNGWFWCSDSNAPIYRARFYKAGIAY